MFIEKQPETMVKYYERLLKAVGAFSNLFSASPEPYLSYRVVENLFCIAFGAENLSRFDNSADALKDKIGFGIKTFVDKTGSTLQKVAEFNSDHEIFRSLCTEQKIRKIAELRNTRITTTKRIYGLENLIYHCVTRQVGKITVYETPTPIININKISRISENSNGNIIQFHDSTAEYSFNISKSTLYKRFITDKILLNIAVKILADPFSQIEKLVSEGNLIFSPVKVQPHIFLPLYSPRSNSRQVPEKSGLNLWNSKGRSRNANEVEIRIPAWINKKFSAFFPAKDKSFSLFLPDRSTLSAKICQQGEKALMSKPNSKLGKWILRDILMLNEGEILTYDKLQILGLDSVVVYKINSNRYDIDFARIGSYEAFFLENKKINSFSSGQYFEQDI
ncbi:MAG: NgoFVII family restriction endonuclease [Ignavibacteria bacterium]